MLHKLRSRLTYANVISTLALFGVLAGGTAYAANSVFSADIVDGEVKSVDVGDNEIKSADVKDQSLTTFDVSTFLGADVVDGTLTGADIGDGSLKDEDIGEGASVNLAVSIGSVPAQDCTGASVTGLNAKGDHVLLTPSGDDANADLSYTAEYQNTLIDDRFFIVACNPTAAPINDNTTHFNVLVINGN
jgi:hypothetical protein